MQTNERVVIGKEGAFSRFQSRLVDGWEPCDTVYEIVSAHDNHIGKKYAAGLFWIAGKIPKAEMGRMLAVMREFKDCETGFLLAYNGSSKTYRILLPPQTNSTGVALSMGKMPASEIPEGYSVIGTFHTHPHCIPAHWSSVDRADQQASTSIHTVLSLDNDGKVRNALCTLFTTKTDPNNGSVYHHEYDQVLEDVFEDPTFTADEDADKSWVDKIKRDHAAISGVPTSKISSTSASDVPVSPIGRTGVSQGLYAGYGAARLYSPKQYSALPKANIADYGKYVPAYAADEITLAEQDLKALSERILQDAVNNMLDFGVSGSVIFETVVNQLTDMYWSDEETLSKMQKYLDAQINGNTDAGYGTHSGAYL